VADLNLSNLGMQERNGSFNAEVLNGIAWNKEDNTLWVTGKYWKNIYILDVSSLPNP
jgi:glutamine cyclotransferase